MDYLKILVVEDDDYISNMLKELLNQNGYTVLIAYSGTEALLRIEKEEYNIIILDIMLPGLNGKEVLKNIRNKSDVPIITLSAINDINTKVELLKSGADDYITKPFDNNELLARIETILRRKSFNNSNNILKYKDIILNKIEYKISVSGKDVNFTKNEFNILELLMENPNRVYTKNNIFEYVWKEDYIIDDNVINVHISNIRKKLLKASKDKNDYIQTVWGIGFKLK